MKALLKKTIDKIELSGNEIAELFLELCEYEQADFFNRLGVKSCLVYQLQAITDCIDLDSDGRLAMQRIGEYASKTS